MNEEFLKNEKQGQLQEEKEISDDNEKISHEKTKVLNNEFFIYLITIILLIVPILLAFFGPASQYTHDKTTGMWIFKKTTEVVETIKNPFRVSTLAGFFGVLFYTMILAKNTKTLFVDEERKKLDIKNVVLHVINLIFTTTVFGLIPENGLFGINMRALMIVAFLMSFLSMKTISGYLWILIIAFMLPTLTHFDNWSYGYLYIIFAYLSLVSQVFIIKLFKFSLNDLLIDFGYIGKNISSDISTSLETTKEGLKSTINSTKNILLSKNY